MHFEASRLSKSSVPKALAALAAYEEQVRVLGIIDFDLVGDKMVAYL